MTPRARQTHRSLLRLEPMEDRTVPATITVSTLADDGAGSLRAAVAQANTDPAPDTIVFDEMRELPGLLDLIAASGPPGSRGP